MNDSLRLRHAILTVLGIHPLTGCGGLVVFEVDDGSGGASATTAGPTSGNTSAGPTSGSTTSSSAGPCEGAVPIISPDGFDTGYVRCADGSVNRAFEGQCYQQFAYDPCQGDEDIMQCTTNAECSQMPGGKCIRFTAVKGSTMCQCSYSCATDADCGSGDLACVCPGMLPHLTYSACAPKGCSTNADCPSGECGVGTYDDGCGRQNYLVCRSAEDACRTDQACASISPAAECAPAGVASPFECHVPSCDIGRPLFFEGRARTAPRAARADWLASKPEVGAELDEATRRAAASYYEEVAAMEHASVASFARFALQLLSLGAPAELLEGAQRAGLEEIEHARVAYSAASVLGGSAVGPDSLTEALAPMASSPADIVRALVEEACVGETLGAAEAALAAAAAAAPLRGDLERIAEDEQRHAELGWRALAWMLRRDPGLTSVARKAFSDAARLERFPAPNRHGMTELGIPSGAQVEGSRAATLREVVWPCARALLGASVVAAAARPS